MKGQWGLILGIIAALIIAIFAVINVELVQVNYLFGIAEWPLILVILGSVLLGGILVGAVGMVKVYRLQSEIKELRENDRELRQGSLKSNDQSNTEKSVEEKDKDIDG